MRWLILSSLLIIGGCMLTPTPTMLRYVALGDSYTSGEGVAIADRWPNQLVERLQADGIAIELVANPSHTAWTTQRLIDEELPILDQADADVVTLLIGVNDYVQGISLTDFEARYRMIVDHILTQVPANHLILITIPDFSATPSGQTFRNATAIHAELAAYNQAIMTIGADYNLVVIDIFDITGGTVRDGLHPDASQYTTWVDRIYPVIKALIQ